MKSLNPSSTFFLLGILLSIAHGACAEIVFSETFDNYDRIFNNRRKADEKHYGLPRQGPKGSDEIWYGGRFEQPDNGTINQDLAVQEIGGSGNWSPVGRFEDEAGLLFDIGTGYRDITLSFDWRTYSADPCDHLVAGYYIGDLGFDDGPNRFRDFYADDFGGNHNAAVNWWDSEWTELVRGRNNCFMHESFTLPDTGKNKLWVAFWLDGGECDYGKIDNILVEATTAPDLIPEPATALLLGFAGLLVSGIESCRKR
ncbi:MAG: hypothetical protein KJN98_05580, partial [Pontiella sp.]|nr:hypothetical protein [Pontiella sp.]